MNRNAWMVPVYGLSVMVATRLDDHFALGLLPLIGGLTALGGHFISLAVVRAEAKLGDLRHANDFIPGGGGGP